MAKNVIQSTILSINGGVSVAPGASIEIRNAVSGLLVPLWLDRDGTQPTSNPFTADSNGFFRVYADAGRYHITASKDGQSQEWRDVLLGSAAGYDVDDIVRGLSLILSVMDYIPESEHQAIVDGTSTYDCTADIQAAIYDAVAIGAGVWHPRGVYNVKNLKLPSGVRILGAGKNASIWRLPDNSNTSAHVSVAENESAQWVFAESDESTWDSDIFIFGMGIDPNRHGQSTSGTFYKAAGLHLQSVRDVRVIDCRIVSGIDDGNRYPTRGGAVTIHNGFRNITFTDCVFETYTGWQHNQVTVYDVGYDVEFVRCHWPVYQETGFVANPGVICLQMSAEKSPTTSHSMRVIDCVFENAENVVFQKRVEAILLHGPNTTTDFPEGEGVSAGRGSIVSGCTFRGIGTGVRLLETQGMWRIVNNHFERLTRCAVLGSLSGRGGKVGVVISGNVFYIHQGGDVAPPENGEIFTEMYLDRFSDVVISGNVFRASPTDDSPTTDIAPVHLIGCQGVSVFGNAGSLNGLRPFVLLRDGTTGRDGYDRQTDRVLITGNVINRTTNGGIDNLATGGSIETGGNIFS